MRLMDFELSFEESRVLGVLIEKEFTTPDQYPMSLHGCMLGCNQKSNREPVVEFTETDVLKAIENMQLRNIVVRSHPAGSRVEKYAEALGHVTGLEKEKVVLLSVLFLRGAQTPGELSGRIKRALPQTSIQQVDSLLQELSASEKPWVRKLERRPGQKESRWAQLLTGEVEEDVAISPSIPQNDRINQLETDFEQLKSEFSELKEEMNALKESLGA